MEIGFVWGVDRRTGDPWFLPDGTAELNRAHVKSFIRCPVPDCAAQLTTVSLTRGRDHLRHLTDGLPKHSVESRAHSQGCAAVHQWLRGRYPRSTVIREEYTNAEGERRADVLLTGPQGHRIAFEVQYSPLTQQAWQERHESYRRQGIVDVWLFGCTTFKPDRDAWFEPSPMHEASLRTGAPLVLIDASSPDNVSLTVVATRDWLPDPDDYEIGRRSSRPRWEHGVETWTISSEPGHVRILTYPLQDFEVHPTEGLTHDSLETLRCRTAELADAHATISAWVLEEERRLEKLQERRRAQVAHISELLANHSGSWADSPLHAAISAYWQHGKYLKGRIDVTDGVLAEWQCIIYFTRIAGQQGVTFTVKDAFEELRRCRIRIHADSPFREIHAWLRRLYDGDFIDRHIQRGQYPIWFAVTKGSMW